MTNQQLHELGMENSISRDLSWSIVLGSAHRNPDFAWELLDSLPDKTITFQGRCIVYPSLRGVDPERAEEWRKGFDPMPAPLAHALAWSKIWEEGRPWPNDTDVYADYVLPYDQWPGPRFSRPLRY